jgi:nucleoside-diphosphate-sugar epimerase
MTALKVAVTGATGFVGRYVLEELLRHDVEIVATARNTKSLANRPEIHAVELDIATPPPDIFERLGRPDVMIHLAWNGLPNYHSLHHFSSELPNQFSFLRLVLNSGLPSLVVAGTCFEYGMKSGCLSEDLVTEPSNSYGYAKDALRKQIGFLKSEHMFNLVWARLFYIYGEDQPKASLYPQLRDAALSGKEIFNMSGGEQLRDYLPISEVARQIVALALSGRDLGVVNVCSGNPVSVRALVERWICEKQWKLSLNLGHYPYPIYEPLAFWGDATRIRHILNAP